MAQCRPCFREKDKSDGYHAKHHDFFEKMMNNERGMSINANFFITVGLVALSTKKVVNIMFPIVLPVFLMFLNIRSAPPTQVGRQFPNALRLHHRPCFSSHRPLIIQCAIQQQCMTTGAEVRKNQIPRQQLHQPGWPSAGAACRGHPVCLPVYPI